MNRIALVSLSGTLLLIFSGHASACWCRHEVLDTDAKVKRAIQQELRTSTVVFSGQVIEKTTTGLRFRILTKWKGNLSNEIVFTSKNYVLQTSENGEQHFIWDCAYAFEVGQTYLVYAQRDHGQLEVSKCSRTQFMNDAARDLAELERLTRGTRARNKSAPQIARIASKYFQRL